ncbi:MAG: ParA family protein [Cryobacterium sp.]|nr:ParA family protein [Oligoflexia bacterium]
MASFKDIHFTPAEFAAIAKLDKSMVPELEASGQLTVTRKKVGNVDRKMISLEDMQAYFHRLRDLADGEGAVSDGPQIPIEAVSDIESVATATGFTPVTPQHRVQMFYNVKGGTGKSTLTAQYVMRAAMMGYRVLAIDLDGQGHLTVNLDILDGHERPTIYDVLINDLPIEHAIMSVAPGLDLIPANLGLCNIEIPLNNKARREYRLGEAIRRIADQYDLIVADTNPAASILNGSMLVASNLVNVVCSTNPLSFHGMSLVMATIENMQREFQRDLTVRIIPNMYDNREVISQEVLGELRGQFSDFCTKTVMNRSADMNEATKRRTTVWDVNAKGVAAQDVNSLTEELVGVERDNAHFAI